MLVLSMLSECSNRTFHIVPSQDHGWMIGAPQLANGAPKVLIHHALVRLCDFFGNYVRTGNQVVFNWYHQIESWSVFSLWSSSRYSVVMDLLAPT